MKKLILALVCLFGSLQVIAQDLPKDSLYTLESHWKNQEGIDTPFKKFVGTPVIIAMTYTGCQYSCPMTLSKLGEIEKDLKKLGVQKYQFVVASFDAEKDKPAVLKSYMTKRKLDDSHWTLLSAQSDSDVRELAVLLNVNYQKIEGGDFSHSNGITLLDSSGRVVLQVKGLAADHKDLLEKMVSYEKQN